MSLGFVFACASHAEARALRRLGGTAIIVGLACSRTEELTLCRRRGVVSVGVAGALRDNLPVCTVIDAVCVVDERGKRLWAGGPLGVRNARLGVILAASRVIDEPDERRWLHERTGADIVDLESGKLAERRLLAGCVRVVSDTPERRLGALAGVVRPDGAVDFGGLCRAFKADRRGTARALRDAAAALRALKRVRLI